MVEDMDSIKKEIIIIAFKFPPMGGVGTRRWTKFAKYLAERNYLVHVITIDYKYNDTVNWLKDVEKNENIIIHRLKPGCPDALIKNRNNFLDKIKNRLFYSYLKKYFYYIDPAQNWAKYFVPYTRELIRKNDIKNVIVTGAPFSVMYQAVMLKIENPEINLIQDFRDPWNNDIPYEYKNNGSLISYFWQKNRSIKMEESVIFYSDKIIFVTNGLKERYNALYKIFSDKFYTIHNGFDEDDFKHNNHYDKKKKFNLIYTGNLGFGRTLGIELLAQAIHELNDDYINNNLKIDFYTPLKMNYFIAHPNFNVFKNNFDFYPMMPPDNIYEILRDYYCCLSINAKVYPYLIGAKVFEYMGAEKKIFHISDGGELSAILRNKNQYLANYDVNEIKRQLLKLKQDFLTKTGKVNYSEFSLNLLVNKLINLLS